MLEEEKMFEVNWITFFVIGRAKASQAKHQGLHGGNAFKKCFKTTGIGLVKLSKVAPSIADPSQCNYTIRQIGPNLCISDIVLGNQIYDTTFIL